MGEAELERAAAVLGRCAGVIDAGTPAGSFNQMNQRLLRLAAERGIPVYRGWQAWAETWEGSRM